MTWSIRRSTPLAAAILIGALAGCAVTDRATSNGGMPSDPVTIGCPQCGQWRSVGPGDYAAVADSGPADGHNAGAVGNSGLVAGPAGTILIGTGSSASHGAALLAAARRVSDRPVVAGINLQASPEHVLGNGVLAGAGIRVIAHRATEQFMRRNCERCLRDVNNEIGASPPPPASIDLPGSLIDGDIADRSTGRTIEILHLGHTYQPGSLVVVDRAAGVAWLGNLASIGRVPDIANADIDRWLAALDTIERLGVTTIVPGFGPVAPTARLKELSGYLNDLRDAVGRSFRAGRTLQATQREAALPAYASWAMHDRLHPKNVQRLYLQMESAELASPAR